jgi:hypothetical protein
MQLPNLSPRRRAGAAAIACAAALTPVAALAGTASPAAPAASTPACQTSGLVIWVGGAQGALGTIYYNLNYTNLSGHACTMRGHPGISAVDMNGGQIGASARWGNPGNVKTRTVRLANGATATSVLAVQQTGVFPQQVCQPVTSAGLRVYPPNQFTSKLVPYPIGACSTKQIFMTAGVVSK